MSLNWSEISGVKSSPAAKEVVKMEVGIAKLESDVEYIKRDMADVKGDIKEIKSDIRDIRGILSELKIHVFQTENRLIKWGVGLLLTTTTISFLVARYIPA